MYDEEFDFDEFDQLEGILYLIEEDFWEIELIFEKYFKFIMQVECEVISLNEQDWLKLMMFQFFEWFSVKVGVIVVDLEKMDLFVE